MPFNLRHENAPDWYHSVRLLKRKPNPGFDKFCRKVNSSQLSITALVGLLNGDWITNQPALPIHLRSTCICELSLAAWFQTESMHLHAEVA